MSTEVQCMWSPPNSNNAPIGIAPLPKLISRSEKVELRSYASLCMPIETVNHKPMKKSPVERSYLQAASSGLKFGEDVLQQRCGHLIPYNPDTVQKVFNSSGLLSNQEVARRRQECDLSHLYVAPLKSSYLKLSQIISPPAVTLQKPKKLAAVPKSSSIGGSAKRQSANGKRGSSSGATSVQFAEPPGLQNNLPPSKIAVDAARWDEHLMTQLSASTARWIVRNRHTATKFRERLDPLLDVCNGPVEPDEMIELVGDDASEIDTTEVRALPTKPWSKEKDLILEKLKQIANPNEFEEDDKSDNEDMPFYQLPVSAGRTRKSKLPVMDEIAPVNSTAQRISVLPYAAPPPITLKDVINPRVGNKLYETSNRFQQDLLLGARPVHQPDATRIVLDSKSVYKKHVSLATPKPADEWVIAPNADVDAAGEVLIQQNGVKIKSYQKGMLRWKALPEPDEDSAAELHVQTTTVDDVEQLASLVMNKSSSLIDIVNEWRSLWRLDMRYSEASADDLIRDMADLHVDVRLRAIVTCARAAEYASDLPNDGARDKCNIIPERLLTALKYCITDKNDRVCRAAAIALYALGRPCDEAEDLLQACAQDEKCIDQWTAVRCLAYYGECDGHIVSVLVNQLLMANNGERQNQAANHLTELSRSSSLVHALLGEQLNSGSWVHRAVACRMLCRLHGEISMDIVNKLKLLMWSDWNKVVRAAAMQALAATGYGLIIHDSLLDRLADGSTDIIRADALSKLGQLGIMTAKMLAAFLGCFNDDYASVRIETCIACTRLRVADEQVVSKLVGLVRDDPIHKVKAVAIQALAQIGVINTAVRNTLLWAFRFDTDDAVRAEACRAFIKLNFSGDEVVQTIQDRYLVETSDFVKHEITAALARLGVSPTDDIPMVVAVKKAVQQMCSSEVVCQRIVANESKRLRRDESKSYLLRPLTQSSKASRSHSRSWQDFLATDVDEEVGLPTIQITGDNESEDGVMSLKSGSDDEIKMITAHSASPYSDINLQELYIDQDGRRSVLPPLSAAETSPSCEEEVNGLRDEKNGDGVAQSTDETPTFGIEAGDGAFSDSEGADNGKTAATDNGDIESFVSDDNSIIF